MEGTNKQTFISFGVLFPFFVGTHMFDPNKFVPWSCCCRLLLFLPLCLCRDTITNQSPIKDSLEDTLVSEGGRFVLGFFSPDGNSTPEKRYVGIWYSGSDPRTVVWVANRDNPLLNRTGYIGFANDGNLVVATEGGSSKNYWDSGVSGAKAQLLDSGNLVLWTEGTSPQKKWQSFEHPTDTFLPGMLPDSLNLTSWKGPDDPGVGDFTFQKDEESQGQYMISKQQSPYWKTGIYGKFVASDDSLLAQAISGLLNLGTASPPPPPPRPGINSTVDYNITRLRITSDGAIQYLIRGKEASAWSRLYNEPRERCELISFCGKYGSCNTEDVVPCKCLPGFEPLYPGSWENGDFRGGCKRKSSSGDTFVNLTFVKAGKPSGEGAYVETEFDCSNLCLDNKNCQAYSYIVVDQSRQRGAPQKTCWRWFDDLDNIQEFAEGGANLSVRVSVGDIAPLTRSCKPCGTNLVPYPLSTGEDCGDLAYSFFTCSSSTARLHFQTLNRNYLVLRVDEETHQFTIRLKNSSECASGSSSISLAPNQTSQFYFRNCSHTQSNFRLDASTGEWLTEVDMGWNLSKVEPLCSSFSDCGDWPQTTCNAAGDGKKRCLCPSNLRWNSTALNCTGTEAYTYQPSAGGGGAGKKPLYLISLVAIPIIIAVVGFIYRRRNSRAKHVKRQSATVDLERRLYDSERRVKEWISSGQFGEDDKKDIDVPFFDLEVILGATDNFSDENKLGRGGFGPVYKGKFPGGQEIAVKRLLSASGQGLEEFKNEVMLIAKLQHRNLVKLLGYCVEGDEKMLLYEYMPNKSLDSFLFDPTKCALLTWEIRLEIILGIARGMLYLHQDSRLRIIHRDLKASNVLLDEEMNPKISDFGLARIFQGKQTEASTQRVIGTYGYMSPEYALDGSFSFKSDVFSFGVVVLEIICGKRNTGIYLPEGKLNILSHAWTLWTENKAVSLVDSVLEGSCNKQEVLKCINVALLCVQDNPNDRPTMSNVLFMLGGEIATLPTPKKPAFALNQSVSSTGSSSMGLGSSLPLSSTMHHGR